jgi:RNA polymerase sigma factor (sigma-70 family)
VILWKDREKLINIRSPHSYIFYSFRNYILKEKRKLQEVAFQKEEQEFGIDNFIIHKETTSHLNNQLNQALKSLTPRQREAIFLRFYEALSFEEVAQIMNISIKATYKLVARSLLKLKDLLNHPVLLIIALLLEITFLLYKIGAVASAV